MEKATEARIGLRMAVLAFAAILAACDKHSAAVVSSAPPVPTPTDASNVTRIVIDDHWAGFNPISPIRSHWIIERDGSGFVLFGTRSQQHLSHPAGAYSRTEERDTTTVTAAPLSGPAVESLVHALRAPPQSSIDLNLFGSAVTHASETIDKSVQKLVALDPPPALRQRIVDWGNGLRQGQPLADAITTGVANAYHSDDYPSARVEATFADGSGAVLYSNSQNLLMLPWSDASGRKSFSAELPRALAALLPSISSNRGRLTEVPSQDKFDDYLGSGISDEESRFQVQIVAPEAYAALQSHFDIRDIDPVDMRSHRLRVTVGLSGGPPNLSLRTQLAIKGKALARPADLDAIRTELNTATAATGLRQAMQSAPNDDFSMNRGIGLQPFHTEAKKQFIAQMGDAHKLPELAKHPDLLDGAVMVAQGYNPTYWVALRDRRAIVWKEFVNGKLPPGHRSCAGVPILQKDFPDLGNLYDCLGLVYDAAGKAL